MEAYLEDKPPTALTFFQYVFPDQLLRGWVGNTNGYAHLLSATQVRPAWCKRSVSHSPQRSLADLVGYPVGG